MEDMPIQLWALSIRGEIYCFPYEDLASAQETGESMVRMRAWRTWDAFEVATGRRWGGKLLASHGRLAPMKRRATLELRAASERAARTRLPKPLANTPGTPKPTRRRRWLSEDTVSE